MLPYLLLQLGDRDLVPSDNCPCIVHQDVDAPVVVHHLVHHPLDLPAVSQIAVSGEGPHSGGLRLFFHGVNAPPAVANFGGWQVLSLAVHICQGYVGAQPGQLHDRGPSHASHSTGAGYQRYLAFKSCHFASP